ncbi:MAG: sigma-54-dependent transcriptional regulator [Candidatus Hydrogenedentota bacterium]
MPRKQHLVLAYNGIDGACAAAMVLLAHPDAEVRSTSARGIGGDFERLATERWDTVHVCGLGVWCDWEEVAAPAARMRGTGTDIIWHCGRGYLDKRREAFAEFCTPAFNNAGTNTGAVARTLNLGGLIVAHVLIALAQCDPHVPKHDGEREIGREEGDWLDLIEAAMAQYFKFQDRAPYLRAIRKLAQNDMDQSDRAVIEHYRRTGMRYVLHGRSPVMKRLRTRIQQCADADRHVIITGASGVGKEHVAHLLRERSTRHMGPFIAVNCALYAGNAGLANSDLFGHVKGAFTGAVSARKGKFAEADTGILYLDEIGDLVPEVQAKLLRVIEDGMVTPEGADQPQCNVDVCIFAATNMDLPAMIRRGEFRADLYHRLATLRIHVPPLRERAHDIRTIVDQRLDVLREEGHERTFAADDYAAFQTYPWPGNVRQLIKLVDRAVLLDMTAAEAIAEEQALGELVAYDTGAEDAPPSGRNGLWPRTPADVVSLKTVQQHYARRAWELHNQNTTQAARALGITANTLRNNWLKGADET